MTSFAEVTRETLRIVRNAQYRHQRGGDPVKLERGRLARCTTASRMFSAETIPRELLRAPRQHTAVPVCDTHVVLFRGDSFDAAQWLQDAQGHAPAQIAVLDFAIDTEPGGVCVLITYVCGRFMRVPVCVCVCVCLCVFVHLREPPFSAQVCVEHFVRVGVRL